jgi:hypothetical protein
MSRTHLETARRISRRSPVIAALLFVTLMPAGLPVRGGAGATGSAVPTSVGTVPASATGRSVAPPTTGVSLQIRVGRFRIEFPWLRALPVAPGVEVTVSVAPGRGRWSCARGGARRHLTADAAGGL